VYAHTRGSAPTCPHEHPALSLSRRPPYTDTRVPQQRCVCASDADRMPIEIRSAELFGDPIITSRGSSAAHWIQLGIKFRSSPSSLRARKALAGALGALRSNCLSSTRSFRSSPLSNPCPFAKWILPSRLCKLVRIGTSLDSSSCAFHLVSMLGTSL